MKISDSSLKLERVNVSNFNFMFGLFIHTTGSINMLNAEGMTVRTVIMFRRSYSFAIQNSDFLNISNSQGCITAFISDFEQISNIKFSNITLANCIIMQNSNASLIHNVTFENVHRGIELTKSSVNMMSNINMTRDVNISNSLNLYYTNVTIQNSTFINNYNDKGGAIKIE